MCVNTDQGKREKAMKNTLRMRKDLSLKIVEILKIRILKM